VRRISAAFSLGKEKQNKAAEKRRTPKSKTGYS
jgi:hypothetical protein